MNRKELKYHNRQLRYQTPHEIALWALELDKRSILTTSFGRYSATLIHLLNGLKSDIPVIWCDTGFYNEQTYAFAHKMMSKFDLNLFQYVPEKTSAYLNFLYERPLETGKNFDEFVEAIKLQPLKRALSEHQPELWFTNIREDQTDFRRSQNILSMTDDGILKVSPFYFYSEEAIKDYMTTYKLPINEDYFDVTKQRFGDECGIQLL